jgi:hypothetical protein
MDDTARNYAAFLNATGQRFRDRETTLFCEAVEAMDAPKAATPAPTPMPPADEPLDLELPPEPPAPTKVKAG